MFGMGVRCFVGRLLFRKAALLPRKVTGTTGKNRRDRKAPDFIGEKGSFAERCNAFAGEMRRACATLATPRRERCNASGCLAALPSSQHWPYKSIGYAENGRDVTRVLGARSGAEANRCFLAKFSGVAGARALLGRERCNGGGACAPSPAALSSSGRRRFRGETADGRVVREWF